MAKNNVVQAASTLAVELAKGLAADKNVPILSQNVPEIAASLKPQLLHVTNNEPWYQSRVTWGTIISLISAILAIFGVTIEAEVQLNLLNGIVALAAAIGLIAGPLYSLYGRFIARKPIGS